MLTVFEKVSELPTGTFTVIVRGAPPPRLTVPAKASEPGFAALPKVTSLFKARLLPSENAVLPFAMIVVPVPPTVSVPGPSAELLPMARTPALSVVPPV